MQFAFNYYWKLSVKRYPVDYAFGLILYDSEVMKESLELIFYGQAIQKSIWQWKMNENQLDTRDQGDACGKLDVRLHNWSIIISPFIFFISAQNFAHSFKINLYWQCTKFQINLTSDSYCGK